MKKILIVLCLSILAVPVFAENIYDYKNTQPLNDIHSVRMKGCNEYVKVEPTRMFEHAEIPNTSNAVARNLVRMAMDPYVVNIDGNNYVLVKDRNDKNWSEKDLLGIDDPKENRFASLIALNSDGNYGKLTTKELKKANIRFVRLDSNGVLLVNERNKDYNLDKIDYIDLIHLKRTANAEVTGIFGHFTVYIKTNNSKKRTVIGYVTYETDKKIKYMFK